MIFLYRLKIVIGLIFKERVRLSAQIVAIKVRVRSLLKRFKSTKLPNFFNRLFYITTCVTPRIVLSIYIAI